MNESAVLSRAEVEPTASVDAFLPGANWKWFVLRGVLTLVLGGVSIAFPASALFAFTMVFAAYALIDGVFSIVSGVKGARRKQERWWALIVRGLIGILAAGVFVLMPVVATVSYALASLVLLAAWAIVAGVFEITAAIRLRKEIKGEWLLGISGALSILLGFAIPAVLVLNPLATILSVAWIVGMYALIAGIALIVLGLRLRTRLRASGGAGEQHSKRAL